MTTYSEKIINNLKPQWFYDLSGKEKKRLISDMLENHKVAIINKPKCIKIGVIIVAKRTRKKITNGKNYRVIGHFCTLISTIYDTHWNQFVTLKNDNGWTVKMNICNFKIKNVKY